MERLDWTSGAPLRQLLWRHAMLGLASMAIMFPMVLPAVFLGSRRAPLDFAIRLSIMQGVFIAAFGALFGGVCPGLGEAVFGSPAERSWRRAAAFLVGAAFSLPGFAFVFYWGLSGDFWGSVNHLLFACWFAPVFPALCLLLSWQIHTERSYERQWAELNLDE
jgi:hypothetical protein